MFNRPLYRGTYGCYVDYMTQTATQPTIPSQSTGPTTAPEIVPAPAFDPALPTAIIVDIDGTVAINDGHRSPFDWAKVGADLPNWPAIQTVRNMSRGGYWVLFTSGRMDECRGETLQWLSDHVAITRSQLFMRKTGDMRPDSEVKLDLYNEHIRGQFNILYALDDRERVVELWCDKLRIPVLQVRRPGVSNDF